MTFLDHPQCENPLTDEEAHKQVLLMFEEMISGEYGEISEEDKAILTNFYEEIK